MPADGAGEDYFFEVAAIFDQVLERIAMGDTGYALLDDGAIITATLDKGGSQIAGDPQKIKEVTDIWTFSRDVSSKRALENLNWKLVATQAPN